MARRRVVSMEAISTHASHARIRYQGDCLAAARSCSRRRGGRRLVDARDAGVAIYLSGHGLVSLAATRDDRAVVTGESSVKIESAW